MSANPLEIVTRKIDMRGRPEPAPVVKRRMAEAAAALTRAGDLALHCELANEAIQRYTTMLYERDSDGYPANVELETGRLLVAAPWGNKGWRAWGLRHWEAIVLRAILMERAQDPTRPGLFIYDHDTRGWRLNLSEYPSLAQASFFFGRGGIKVAEWRKHAGLYREREAQRKRTAAGRKWAGSRKRAGTETGR